MQLAGKSEVMKKAVKRLQEVSADKEVRKLIDYRDDAIRTEHAIRKYEREEGIREEHDRMLGKAYAEKLESARIGLQNNLPFALLQEMTGLDEATLRKLQDKLKHM